MPNNNSQNSSEVLVCDLFGIKKLYLHSVFKTSPYEVMFRSSHQIGLVDSSIDSDVNASKETEDDFQEPVLSTIKTNFEVKLED